MTFSRSTKTGALTSCSSGRMARSRCGSRPAIFSNWDAATLTYTDGENSVKVSGVIADEITLKFGDDGSQEYAKLSDMGAFDSFSSQRIFEGSGTGTLASL